jgi:hypothetical protein
MITITSQKIVFSAVVLGGILFGVTVAAGEEPPARSNIPRSFSAQLDRLDREFARIEALSAERAKATTIAAADLDSLPSPTENLYSGEIKRAFDSAVAAAELYANTEGQKGNIDELKALEHVVQNHIAQFGQVQETADRYLNDLKNGTIRLAPEALTGRTEAELQEFRAFLSPSAVGLYPELRALDQRGSLDSPRAADFASLEERGSPTPDASSCFYAIVCYAVCASGDFVDCLACIVTASAALASYYFNTFLPCWNNLKGKPWYVAAWVWRAKCLAYLLAKVA